MSSLLSFGWKSHRGKPRSFQKDSIIPDVTPAGSNDVLSPSSTIEDRDETSSFVTAIEPPLTPEGLKPRKPLALIRQELGIPLPLLMDEPRQPIRTNHTTILPPRLIHSPQITNSSFYSRSSASDRVAESPNLAAPTTAVGALVKSATLKTQPFLEQTSSTLLPPRPFWLQDEEEENNVLQYQSLHDDEDDDSSREADQERYHQLTAGDSSFSSNTVGSQVSLVGEHAAPPRYNFDPILHNLNVSAISGSSWHGDETALLQRKTGNQRRHKEQLLMECYERFLSLDDNMVAQLLESTDYSLCFSPETALTLSRFVSALLLELDAASTQEFFFQSPTQMPGGETHAELGAMLKFVQKLLVVPKPSDVVWSLKHDVRVELEPSVASPEITRGGDTSLFSLPPDDTLTPHTSNVSMATTLPSKPPSPPSGTGTTRRTLATVYTLEAKLVHACRRQAVGEMKKLYLQLLALKISDLHHVMDAFYQDVGIVRTVSIETEQDEREEADQPLRRHLLGAFESKPPMPTEHSHVCLDQEEDLRRHVGSNDYDSRQEIREGPEDEAVREFYYQQTVE